MAKSRGGAYCKYCGDPCDIVLTTTKWNYDNWEEFAVSSCCEEELVDEAGEELTIEQIDAIYDPTPW